MTAARSAQMVHFGSVALAEEPAHSAVLSVIHAAKKASALISYDPNLRFALWDDPQRLKQIVLDTLPLADVIKVSEEEAEFLFGISDPEQALCHMEETYDAKVLFVTCGSAGAWGSINGSTAFVPAYQVRAVDTTGAGDCFLGAAAYQLLTTKKTLKSFNEKDVKALLRFACAAGSLVTTKLGAIPAIPTKEEIFRCLEK